MLRISKLFVFFVVIAFLGFFIEGEIILNLVFYVTIVILCISIISMIIINCGIESKVQCEKDNYNTTDEFEIKIVVKNNTYLFIPFLKLICKNNSKVNSGKKEIFQMGPLEESEILSEITFDRRGVYNFSDYYIEIKDITMVLTKIKHIGTSNKIKVYPRIYKIKEEYRNKIKYTSERLLGNFFEEKDTYRIKDIRKYNYKDNYRKIHWKMSSKTGELYVKEYENIAKQNISMFIDMNESILNSGVGIEEKYISLAASIIKYFSCLKRNVNVYFGSNYKNSVNFNNESNFVEVMNYFLQNKCGDRDSFFKSLEIHMRSLAKHELICLVVFKIDSKIKIEVEKLIAAQMKIIIFYFDQKAEVNICEYLNRLAVQCFNLNTMF